MRYRWLSLTVLLAGSALALAQQPPTQSGQQPPNQFGKQQPPQLAQPPQQPTLDPTNNRLDAILVNWEHVMSALNSLQTEVTRTTIDKVLMSTDVHFGVAKYMKPNKASVWLRNKDPKKLQEYERIVCNGQTAYKWEPSRKEVHQYDLPKPKQGQINDDNFVAMLFGMKAIDAKRRYELQLPPPPHDKWYHYILVSPRDPQDKAEFTKARLSLLASSYLPAEIWYEQPNGNETKYSFTNLAPNHPQISSSEFLQPSKLDPGWTLKRVTLQDTPPRIIRPQDGK